MVGVGVGMETATTTNDRLRMSHDTPQMVTFSESAYNTLNSNNNCFIQVNLYQPAAPVKNYRILL